MIVTEKPPKARRGRTPEPELLVDPAAIEQFVRDGKTIRDLEETFRQMKKVLMEKVLTGELTHHLGYPPGGEKPPSQPNHRNGSTPKTVLTEDGPIPLAIPRDRAGTFEPLLIPKNARRLPRFDDNVLSLYARGMTVREIQGHLEELYQVAVSPDVISAVTDAVLEEVRLWQDRPLEASYPVLILDGLRVKVRHDGRVKIRVAYLAVGITAAGQKDVLGFWLAESEGAAFWHRVLGELATRGVEDILIAMVDGLAGFPDAITAVFPKAQVHQCVVHLMRRSLTYVSYADRKQVAAALKPIYRAPTLESAEAALRAFEGGPWAQKYPTVAPIWHRAWEQVVPIFQYPIAIRRLLSTTNAIESLNMQIRKIIKTRGHFPSDEAVTKLLFLALRNIVKKWRRASREWAQALPHFAIVFGDRFTPVLD